MRLLILLWGSSILKCTSVPQLEVSYRSVRSTSRGVCLWIYASVCVCSEPDHSEWSCYPRLFSFQKHCPSPSVSPSLSLYIWLLLKPPCSKVGRTFRQICLPIKYIWKFDFTWILSEWWHWCIYKRFECCVWNRALSELWASNWVHTDYYVMLWKVHLKKL